MKFQNREDHDRRRSIGSSNAAAVMNDSPWETATELWEFLTGRRGPIEANYPMRRGIAVEPKVRRAYRELTGIATRSDHVIHPKYPFITATLDALNNTNTHLSEFKVPGIRDHSYSLESQIPRKYIWQLVHQMATTDLPFVNYCSLYSYKDIPEGFKPTGLPRFETAPHDFHFKPSGFESWTPIPGKFIWDREYLGKMRDGESLLNLWGVSDLNCQILTLHRNKELEEQLIDAERKLWEYVINDVRPPEDFMKKNKPDLKLVSKNVEIFKVRKTHSRPTPRPKKIETVSQQIETREEKIISSGKSGYSAREVLEILQYAKELRITELRVDGFEMRCSRAPSE